MFTSLLLKKQHRHLASALLQVSQQPAPQVSHASRYFSAQPAAAEGEAAKAREEWGEKYSDECLQFEKEWKEISGKVEQQ